MRLATTMLTLLSGSAVAAPVNTVAPGLSSPLQMGVAATITPGTWTGTGITYVYAILDSSNNVIAANCGLTPTPDATWAGLTVHVRETATNSAGSASANSSGVVTDIIKLSVTTASPSQVLTLQRITPTGASALVDWGDGNQSTIANGNSGTTTHTYASAATYTVAVNKRSILTFLDLRDTKLTLLVSSNNPMPTGLTTLILLSLANLTWTVGASAPMPTGLTSLTLQTLANLTWTVGASAPMPTGLTSLTLVTLANLTWAVGASAPMPTGLTTLTLQTLANLTGSLALFTVSANITTITCTATNIDGDGWPASLTKLTTITLIGNTWTQSESDTVLLAIYSRFVARTVTGGTISMTGTNAAPSGTLAAQCPPLAGKNAAYELLNDSCAVNSADKWSTVTTS